MGGFMGEVQMYGGAPEAITEFTFPNDDIALLKCLCRQGSNDILDSFI